MKLSACGRADLVRALASGDPGMLAAMARLLGFEPIPPVLHEGYGALYATPAMVSGTGIVVESPPQKSQELVDVPFWRLEDCDAFADTPAQAKDEKSDWPVAWPGWRGKSREAPRFQPLAPWATLLPRLRQAGTERRESHALDTEAIVRCLSQGRMLHCLPRVKRRRWGERLQVIEDRSERLVPYWRDQELVCTSLKRLFPRHGIEHVRYWEGFSDLIVLQGQREDHRYRLPPPGTLVVVLGDLGCLEPDGAGVRRFWSDLGHRLHERGCRIVALLPAPPGRWPQPLQQPWRLLPWERPMGHGQSSRQALATRAERLLRLVSPAVRIEPGFLRAVRRLLDPSQADVGTEADVWQHPAILSTSSVAATLDADEAKRLRRELAHEPADLRRRVLALLRQWRAELPEEIWFEEIRSLDPGSQELLPEPEDLQAAERFFEVLSRRSGSPGAASPAVDAWFRRLERRLPESAWRDQRIRSALHRLWEIVHHDDRDVIPPRGLDPHEVPAHGAPEQSLTVCQRGADLVLSVSEIPTGTPIGHPDSPLGTVHSRNGLIQVIPEAPLSFWREGSPPAWASDWGADDYGLWAEFTLEGEAAGKVTQRLRWIPPGRFMMGSPEDEPERYDDEGPQHEVRISQGFWLFDTACTQALWQAVMGENLSGFQGTNRPVERVSWKNCQAFLTRINELIPGLQLRLPTEAEWEYACRAGTTTPFSFGETITPQLVNYDGNYPYAGQAKGLYRQETVPVKSLPPNRWGLYEMHGNVWEWCLDGQREYSLDNVTDPLGPTDPDVARVLRGGSWLSLARHVRSASRSAYEPGYRDGYFGFRCARAQEGAEPAGPESVRQAERRTTTDQPGVAELLRVQRGTREARCHLPSARTFFIRTDSESLTFGRVTRPRWAHAIGRDELGLWVEFEIEAASGQVVSQRLRWIPPGRFMMGSPENETGRYDDEGPQHEVRLSRGFWLFDTPCTQALWKAVMGKNPSRFRSPDRPVENVSWKDVQGFLEKLNGQLPGLELVLPSEAQWEYACRAGTGTATYAGDLEILGENNAPLLDAIAWYGGNSGVDFDLEDGFDSSDWPEKQYPHERAGTHPVGLKTPNAWGLYDMLGNVYEWCRDDQREYSPDPVIDPVGSTDPDAGRVLRGGSGLRYARGVRSADRLADEPGFRDGGIGFRCARAQE